MVSAARALGRGEFVEVHVEHKSYTGVDYLEKYQVELIKCLNIVGSDMSIKGSSRFYFNSVSLKNYNLTCSFAISALRGRIAFFGRDNQNFEQFKNTCNIGMAFLEMQMHYPQFQGQHGYANHEKYLGRILGQKIDCQKVWNGKEIDLKALGSQCGVEVDEEKFVPKFHLE